jgi:hypothetical protein
MPASDNAVGPAVAGRTSITAGLEEAKLWSEGVNPHEPGSAAVDAQGLALVARAHVRWSGLPQEREDQERRLREAGATISGGLHGLARTSGMTAGAAQGRTAELA